MRLGGDIVDWIRDLRKEGRVKNSTQNRRKTKVIVGFYDLGFPSYAISVYIRCYYLRRHCTA